MGQCASACRCTSNYVDGDSARIVTESYWPEPWQVFTGPLQENGIYDGETYDARLEISWLGCARRPAACRAGGRVRRRPRRQAGRRPARTDPCDRHAPGKADPANPDLASMSSISARTSPAGRSCACRASADRVCRFALPRRCIPTARSTKRTCALPSAEDTYILKGEGEESWEPRFTYHGFRYVQVEGYPGRPAAGRLVGRIVRSGRREQRRLHVQQPTLQPDSPDGAVDRRQQPAQRADRLPAARRTHGVAQRHGGAQRRGHLQLRAGTAACQMDRRHCRRAGPPDRRHHRHGALPLGTPPGRPGECLLPADSLAALCTLRRHPHHGGSLRRHEALGGVSSLRWPRTTSFLTATTATGRRPCRLGVAGSQGSSAVSKDTPG